MSPVFWVDVTLVVALPLALLAGMISVIVWAARAFNRRTGLRFTVRGMMVAVVLLGCWLGTARWWVQHNFATVYASGYSESQFRRVRVGMTPIEVDSILGPPLEKNSTSKRWSHYENWIYSEPPPIGANYWRRWVMFDGGKVVSVVEDYYED